MRDHDVRAPLSLQHPKSLPLIFGRPVLGQIAKSGSSPTFTYVLRQAGYQSSRVHRLWDVYEDVYSYLLRHYRCEYVFKNVIATRLLLARHTLGKATLLSEFRVGIRKADVAILNGTSTVYEVKTGLDNLDRLSAQLEAYRKVFDRICVVTEPHLIEAVAAVVGEGIGLVELTERGALKTRREPASNAENVDPGTIFGSLRRAEYTEILTTELGEVPHLPSGLVWRAYRKLFETLPPGVAHRRMVEVLRRRVPPYAAAMLSALPASLHHAGLTIRLNRKEGAALAAAMNAPPPL